MSGFDFAIGEWKYVTKQKLEDGTYLDWPEADWKFWYILGTENVQDEFVQPTPDGEVILGTGLRVFSPKLDKWICRGIATGSDGWADYEATDHGDHIIMRGKSLQIPNAYERVVDRLLATPEFGERWARHWMDWVRYAESHGSEGNPRIPFAFQYRDYLIRALNDDVAYDQLVREHIAGDLLTKPRINSQLNLNESGIGTAHFRFVKHGYGPTDALEEQVRSLKAFAIESGAIVVMISQIDRAFDLSSGGMPNIDDIRLPNPVDLSLFDKRCFLHGGEVQLEMAP